ncbi:hypothetical protein OEZ85_006967 [Tetradesmus obliquus]|uniref:SURF1-like protein n=1 Tax=Tetradesmus obliquus TaxID=3088 RepID=A0ABY8TW57_TETOB|nr:hypothetical protein OEZ85_006967 [Tetradesmus obliquus]
MSAAKASLLFLPSAVAATMAAWQVQRMQLKQGVVDEATRNMEQQPVDLLQGTVPEFRRVAVQGTYDHSRTAFVGPRPLSYEPKDPAVKLGMRPMLVTPGALKSGFLLVQPLTSSDRQHTVLVNRGWVPPNWKAQWRERFAALQPSGSVSVTGVVQGSESPSGFVPANDAAAGDFFWMDVPGIAESFNLPRDTPMVQVLVDETTRSKGEQPSCSAGVYPLPKPIANVVQFSTMPLGHFNYAVGWGCMSATMGYLAVKVLRKGKR